MDHVPFFDVAGPPSYPVQPPDAAAELDRLIRAGALTKATIASEVWSMEGWMMPERYDLAVVGAGMGGVAVANRAAGLGARVAVIEEHKVGGT